MNVLGFPLVQNAWNHIACVMKLAISPWTNGKSSIVCGLHRAWLRMSPRLGADPYVNSSSFDYFRGAIRSARFIRGLALYTTFCT